MKETWGIKLIIFSIFFIFSLADLAAQEEKAKEDLKENLIAQVKKTMHQVIEYIGGDSRDPFEGYLKKEEVKPTSEEASKEEALPSLTVQGIIWGARFPQAIINNKVVKVDDVVDGVRITDITKNGIVVFFNNRQHTLPSPAAQGTQGKA